MSSLESRIICEEQELFNIQAKLLFHAFEKDFPRVHDPLEVPISSLDFLKVRFVVQGVRRTARRIVVDDDGTQQQQCWG